MQWGVDVEKAFGGQRGKTRAPIQVLGMQLLPSAIRPMIGTCRDLAPHTLKHGFPRTDRRGIMEIDENAPGNQSQQAVTRTTDNETGHDPRYRDSEVPLPPDDEAPADEDMTDVDAMNSVSSEHPEPGSDGGSQQPAEADTPYIQDIDVKEPRGMPASDPESGA